MPSVGSMAHDQSATVRQRDDRERLLAAPPTRRLDHDGQGDDGCQEEQQEEWEWEQREDALLDDTESESDTE